MSLGAATEVDVNGSEPFHTVSGLTASRVKEIDDLACLGQAYREIRISAFGELLKSSFINPRLELWRQTKPELFDWTAFSKTEGVVFGLCCLGDCQAKRERSGFTLTQGLSGADKWVKETLIPNGKDSFDPVSALQLSALSGACVLRISRNQDIKDPIVLSQRTGFGANAAPLIIVVLEEGSRCSLVEDLDFMGAGLYAPRVEVLLGDGSSLDFYSVQRMGDKATYLGKQRFHLGRDANLRTFHAFLGGAVSRLDLDCRMEQRGSTAELNSVYLASGNMHIDYHPIQEHVADHCSSTLTCKGALEDEARGVYYGLIRVFEGADKTDAFQRNKNLVLSEGARVDAVPNLEIRANDVKCSHGAAVGQMGAEEMFYIMSRGLTREQAEKVLVEGFFEDVLSRIKIEKVHELVSSIVLERLHG